MYRSSMYRPDRDGDPVDARPRPVGTTRPPAPATTRPTAPAPAPAPAGAASVGGCSVFPSNNPWNTDISAAPLHPNSSAFISNILANGSGGFLHADFGGGGAYGIPYITVGASQPTVPINFTAYGDESDPGPYPVPLNAPI